MFNRMLEFLLLVIGCGITGFFIGVPQHYVAFGLHGYGFGRDAFLLACLEGGIVGVMLGIPTGERVHIILFFGDTSLSSRCRSSSSEAYSEAVALGQSVAHGLPF
jgi:hypothetical protein